MRLRRYILQRYYTFNDSPGGNWTSARRVASESFLQLCSVSRLHTMRDRVGRQILLSPRGQRLAVFRYDSQGKYYELFTKRGAYLRGQEGIDREREAIE